MDKQSIEQSLNSIIVAIQQSEIKEIDKVELQLNLLHFFMDYEENIKILRRAQNEKKR